MPKLKCQINAKAQMPKFLTFGVPTKWVAWISFDIWILTFGIPAYAQVADLGGGSDLITVVGRLINVFLGILGVVAVAIILWAGYMWMTSGGETETIDRAKKMLLGAVVGLILIFASFAIVRFLFGRFAETGVIGSGGSAVSSGRARLVGSALGEVLEGHWPEREARDVPRNTFISVMFALPMDERTLIREGKVNESGVRIRKTSDSASEGPFISTWEASASEDKKVFVFRPMRPEDFLGSPTANTDYTVTLTENVKTAQGAGAFGTARFYEWSFEVGTRLDLDPPRVVSVLPGGSTTTGRSDDVVPRNHLVQVAFNEPINPLTVHGRRAFINVTKTGGAGAVEQTVAGRFVIAPTFLATEFVPDEKCGDNACGEPVFCLPGDSAIAVRVRSATLQSAGSPAARSPLDGVTDMAANSLDGNRNNRSEGPPPDDFPWRFATSDVIELSSPLIRDTEPAHNESGTPRRGDVAGAVFSKPLRTSLPPGVLNLIEDTGTGLEPFEGHLQVRITNATDSGTLALRTWTPLSSATRYLPRVTSEVRDVFQNCYVPCQGPGCTAREVSPGKYVKSSPWAGPYPSCQLP